VLVVGLGNPGDKYYNTRHNAGFRSVDYLVSCNNGNWKHDNKFSSDVSEIVLKNKVQELSGKPDLKNNIKVKVIKPLLYMNRSGDPSASFFKYYADFFNENFEKSGLSQSGFKGLPIVVVYDDLDFDPGLLKVKTNGSGGGHNGVSDIIRALGRNDFLRVRIGVGHPRRSQNPEISVSDWVLTSPRGEDKLLIDEAVVGAARRIEDIIIFGLNGRSDK
jgi:peptidyl-tRNA hydrolase, PTH1 family